MMIRHSKADTFGIPKPIWDLRRLPMSVTERRTFNTFSALALANMVTTGLDYELHGGRHPDSLLNPMNR